MPNMQAIAPIMTSCAKKRVHAHWKTHAPIHQGVMVVTIGLARYDGNICATANTPSQMKMGPQIEKAKPQQKMEGKKAMLILRICGLRFLQEKTRA